MIIKTDKDIWNMCKVINGTDSDMQDMIVPSIVRDIARMTLRIDHNLGEIRNTVVEETIYEANTK